jgi:hypothetical protein
VSRLLGGSARIEEKIRIQVVIWTLKKYKLISRVISDYMKMILSKFIVLLKDHLEQMFIISKEVFLSGNKGEVIVLYLKNIKLNMSNKAREL